MLISSSAVYLYFYLHIHNSQVFPYDAVRGQDTAYNSLPAEVLATFPCKPRIFRKRVMEVITGEELGRVFEGGDETSENGGKWQMGSEV